MSVHRCRRIWSASVWAREDGFAGECLIDDLLGGLRRLLGGSFTAVETVMSGPVAGAVGADTLCDELGIGLAITGDVGGTSFDTCLLVEGRPRVKYEGEVVGMPLQTPWCLCPLRRRRWRLDCTRRSGPAACRA